MPTPGWSLLLTLVALGAAGCSTDERSVAVDPPAASPSPTPSASPTPTMTATVGSYPDFEPSDYAYTLVVTCFCPDNSPVRVTVVDDEVTTATYAEAVEGSHQVGDPAPDFRALSIDEVIETANDTEAARVEVEYALGQDYPSSVYVDGDEMIADDETGYLISDVVLAE